MTRLAALVLLLLPLPGRVGGLWVAGGVEKPVSKQAREEFEAAQRAARQKRPEDARRGYERAVALDPAYANAWFELGRLQVAGKELDAARRSYEAVIKADPRFLEAYLNLGILAENAGDWRAVVDISERALKVDPVGFPFAWLQHATGSYNLQNFSAAERSARAGQRLDPLHKYPRLWEILGLALVAKGDFPSAGEQLRAFQRFAPSDKDAPYVRKVLAGVEVRLRGSAAGANSANTMGVPTFRVKTELVLVRFQVSPKRGEFITDLRPEDIEIREDGLPQKIAVFEGGRFYPRTAPLEITLLFDASGSVQSVQALNPYLFHENLLDEYENASIAIYAFSDNLIRTTGQTRHPLVLKKAMDAVLAVPGGLTPLFECIETTAREAAARPGAIRMLLVISDGMSEWPGDLGWVNRATLAARERGVSIYPVLLNRPTASVAPASQKYPNAPQPWSLPMDAQLSIGQFMNLASATGGRTYQSSGFEDALTRVLKDIAARIKLDYIAGYYPSSSGQNKRHEVEVVPKPQMHGEISGGKRLVMH